MAKNKFSRASACLVALVLIVTSMCCMGTVAASAAGTYGTTIYLQTDNTTNPYLHYWVDGNAANSSSWPGVKMNLVTGETNVYSYDLPCDVGSLSGVIFNNGGGGDKMTGDVTNITGNLYTLNGSAGSWSMYDTSTLKLALSTDVASPQYKETSILLTAESTGGQGTVTYTFKVNSTTLYTGTNSTCTWVPTTAGTYTLTVIAKDAAGNENTKTASYEIKDDSTAEEPILKSISTGYTGDVPVNTSVPVNVKAAGGKVGTNLLFYKVAITDPSGNAVNTVYYKQSNVLNFTPTKKGDYKVDVTVQNSYNKTTEKTYTITAGEGSTDIAPEITTFTANPTSTTAGTAVNLSTTVKEGTGTENFTYTYRVNGAVVATQTTSSRSNTAAWTPSAAGSYTIQVTVKDSKNLSASKYIYNYSVAEKPTDPDYIPGDVNDDGKVTSADAIYVLRAASGKAGYKITADTKQFKAADMDGNGRITIADAILIARLYL